MVIVTVLFGCSKPSGVTYTPPVLEGDWSVRMNLSGGFDGLLRDIEVKSDGSYVVIDERMKKTSSGDLTETELAKLESLITTLEFSVPEFPTGCADCFIYKVEIESGGKKMIVSADDVSLEKSGLDSLVQFMRTIMDRALR